MDEGSSPSISTVMENYLIAGIQQIGVGVECFKDAWKWYIEMFGMDVRVLEDDTVAERMLPYTGGKPRKRHACIAINLQGGGGFEIWQYSERTPVPAAFPVAAGDLGVFAARIKTRDAAAFRAELLAKYTAEGAVSALAELPDGTPCFFIRDPWGNWFQAVEDKSIFIEDRKLNGGIVGAVIGVSDIDRVIPLYRDVLGYDTVVYDRSGEFGDLAAMPGGNGSFRRVCLTHKEEREGALAGLYGRSSIELVQALDRTPKKLFEGRYWGDPGFIQICFDVTDMRALEKACNAAGYPFTVDSCPNGEHFDMGEASGHFTYVEDPDGTLIEFVEAHKITVLKRPHIYIDMLRRKRGRRFPKVFVRLMGLFRVKFD